jgi:hypothetical protein
LQNCLPFDDVRQGTTSVVPQMRNHDFGFSCCGISKTPEIKETQGLKPDIFLTIYRHD